MALAALIVWLITAAGGFLMAGIWINHGGPRAGTSHLPVPVLFGHFALAVAGLVIWLIYMFTDIEALAWTAVGLIVVVALLGATMFARWLPIYRARAGVPAGPAGGGEQADPPERHFPVPVVAGHGLLAVVTLILVVLTAAGVGGS